MAQSLTVRRTASVTLLVLAQGEAEAAWARQTIEALPLGRAVHGVVLQVGRARPAPLRSFVRGLARGDLPLVLWRPAGLPPVGDESLGWAEHLVVDSRSIARLQALIEITGQLPVTDLAWLDLAPWRHVTAGLFEGPLFSPFLNGVRHVRVQGDEGRRRLLAGWLLGRLRLPRSAVEVLASEHASIDVTAEHEGRRAHFSVAWSADSALIDARAVIGGGPSHRRQLRPVEASTAALLNLALARLGHDPLYVEALTAAITVS